MSAVDLDHLEALASAAGGDQWSDGDADGVVFGADGDSVCICHANMGATPEAIYPEHRAAFIAAANPAAVLDLIAQIRSLTAERNLLIDQRNEATVRAIKAEYPPMLRPQLDLLRMMPQPPVIVSTTDMDKAELTRMMKDFRPGQLTLVSSPSQEEFDAMQERAETAEEVVNGTMPPLVACPQCYTCFDPRTNEADRLDDVLPLAATRYDPTIIDRIPLELMPIAQGEGEYGKFQRHMDNKIANAFAGRIKPLALNLPASLDLPDTEGGAHD